MTDDDDRRPPDSLGGKVRDLLGPDEVDEEDAEPELPADSHERPAPEPKRPTDPPF